MSEDEIEREPIPAATTRLAAKLRRLTRLKERKAAIENEIEVVTAEVDAMLPKTAGFLLGGRRFQATTVRGSTESVDLEYWRKTDPDVFVQITKPVVDKIAFERLFKAGRITERQVLDSVISRPKKTYVLITPEDKD